MKFFPFTCLVLATVLKFVASYNYVDLSFQLDETNLFYPGQRFSYELFKDVQGYNETVPGHERYWFSQFSFCMGDHGGTHLDAPFHFYDKGWKLGEIPLSRLMDVCAVIIDVEKQVFGMDDPRDFALKVEHIQQHEHEYGQIPKGCVIIVHTGWAERYWPDKQKYWGIENGTFNFPGLSVEVAEWLVKEKMPIAVGIDTQSLDVGNFGDSPRVHIIMLPHQIYFIENMANLKELLKETRTGYPGGWSTNSNAGSAVAGATTSQYCDLRLIVLPIKNLNTGGPARVLGYCKRYI